MFVGLWNELDHKQMDLLKSAGMKVICTQNNFGLSILSDYSRAKNLKETTTYSAIEFV